MVDGRHCLPAAAGLLFDWMVARATLGLANGLPLGVIRRMAASSARIAGV
jgi:hypothetical protein